MALVSVTWYGQSGFRLAAGDSRVLIDPFLTDRSDRRYPPPAAAPQFADVTLVLCTHEHADHMDMPFLRHMNETEAAWLCAQVSPSYVIPMHYDAIEGNTGDPGHFVTLAHRSAAPAAVLVPPRARPVTVALP